MISAPVLCRRFVGRSEELRFVAERGRDAAHGRGSVVLVAGDAGIGKSRFVSEVKATLSGSVMGFVAASCFEHVQSPLGPLLEIFGELDDANPSVLDAVPAIRQVLARSFSETRSPIVEISGDRRGQFTALGEALRRFGEIRPTVITIDDLHWADLATLDCIQYLAAKVPETKLVLLATYRADELHRTHPLTQVVSRLQRADNVWRIALRELSDTEMRSLINYALEGHDELRSDTLHQVASLAEGSPLFAEELLKHAIEYGDHHSELPLTIRAAVLDRFSKLEDAERALLTQAAVIGRKFEAEFLAKLSGQDHDTIVATLRRARDLQLIVEERDEDLRYAFRHALVREALYGELLAAEARPLHAKIAERMEAEPASEERDMALAYHWWAARVHDKAATYNERAGDHAACRLAYDDAARFYERAIEFLAEGSGEQAALFRKLGNVLRTAGLAERSKRAYERALSYYRTINDWEQQVDLTANIARQYWLLVDMEASLQTRLQALEIASKRPDHPLFFGCLVQVANHHALADQGERSVEYLRQADVFEGERWASHQVSYHNSWGIVEMQRGNLAGVIEHHHKSIDVAHSGTEPYLEVNARFNLGYCATAFADFATATSAFESAIAVAREQFLPGLEAYALAGLATMQQLAGRYGEARASIERALECEPELHLGGLRMETASVGIMLGLRREDPALVDRFAREDLLELAFRSRESQRIAPMAAAFAELYAGRGEPDRARAVVRRAFETNPRARMRPWMAVEFCRYGAVEDVPRIREMIASWARHPDNEAGRALLALVDAFAARAAGDDPKPLALEAERSLAKLGLPYQQAVALELLGRADEALEIYERIGDTRDARRVRELPAVRRSRAKNELTEREREIASLVALGKANRAIAAELVISERTVENHVASIFGKLGVSSRTELASRRELSF